MSLADLAKSSNAMRHPRKCTVCEALENIPPAEADGLRTLLSDKTLRYTAIRDLVRADPDTPLELHEDAIRRHASGARVECNKLGGQR